jgi:hypothetical protein
MPSEACSTQAIPSTKAGIMEGPLQMLIAFTGLCTACLALCSLAFLAEPKGIADQSYALLKSCQGLLLKGLMNTFLFPVKTLDILR